MMKGKKEQIVSMNLGMFVKPGKEKGSIGYEKDHNIPHSQEKKFLGKSVKSFMKG